MGAKHVQLKDLCVVVYGPLFIILSSWLGQCHPEYTYIVAGF